MVGVDDRSWPIGDGLRGRGSYRRLCDDEPAERGYSEWIPPAASLRHRRVQVIKTDVHAMQAAVIRDCLLKSLFESINLSG